MYNFSAIKHQKIAYQNDKSLQINGGLNTRMTPLLVAATQKSRIQSPDLKNCDLFKTGGISKRLGKTKQGGNLAGAAWASQTTLTNTMGTGAVTASPGVAVALCQKITAPSTASINSISLQLDFSAVVSASNITCVLKADSGGSPGATVTNGTSTNSFYVIGGGAVSGNYTFTFNLPSLTNATPYWICVQLDAPVGCNLFVKGVDNANTNIKITTNNYSTFASPTVDGDIYYVIQAFAVSTSVQGLYDYRNAAGTGTYVQNILASAGGAVYAYDGSSTWTSIKSGLGSGQDVLYDFATIKNKVAICDYATNIPQLWDGSTSGGGYPVMQLGYRATFSAAEASSGSIAAGTYKLMAITQLTTGRYRASAEATVTVTGGSKKIVVSSITMNSDIVNGTQFGFDIGLTATKWFMTANGASVYYKIPAANMSVTNPAANNTTTFDITSTSGLTAANTTLQEYTQEQGSFTSQVDTPKAKYCVSWANFLCLAGDPSNQSRVWFSALLAPQVFGTYGGTLGNYIDVGTDDGQIIRGMKVYNGFLFVFKQHSIYRIEFTGNAGLPFIVTKLVGNIGCLSHWTIKEIPTGLFFLSENGPAVCYGNSTELKGQQIADYFDQNNTNRLNLSAMLFSTASINSLKKQIWWGVSSTSATTRDKVLVYDWELDAWWFNDGVSGNYFATIGDASGFDQFWSGDYSGQVFRHDYGTTDNGSAIDWYWYSPQLFLGDMGGWKWLDNIFVWGKKQSSGTLYVDVFLDGATTADYTVSVSMATDLFPMGVPIPIRGRAKAVQFKLYNSESAVPVEIHGLRLEMAMLGSQT